MPKTAPVQAATTNKWKLAKDLTVALAPTAIVIAACAVIIKNANK